MKHFGTALWLATGLVSLACGEDSTRAPALHSRAAPADDDDDALASIVRSDTAPSRIDERDAQPVPPTNPFAVTLSALSAPSGDVVEATLTWTIGAFAPINCFVTDTLRTVSEDVASGEQDVTIDATTTFTLYCDDCAGHRAEAAVVVAGPG